MSRTIFLFVLVIGVAITITVAKRRTKPYTYKPKHNGTRHAVSDIDIEAESGKTALSSLANEFVHSLVEVTYLINQAVQNSQDNPEFRKSLIQISNDATDLGFAIQKEIHGDPRQLAYQIKSSIIFLTVLLPEVTQLSEKHENTTFASSLLREAIDSTLFAVQKLEVRTDLSNKTNAELATLTIDTFAELFAALNQTKSEDKDVGDELHIQVHHLNHILDKTVNKLEVWLHANTVENENSKVVEEVSQNLGALTANLRRDMSVTQTIPDLKAKIKNTIETSRDEIKKLGTVESNANQNNQEHAKDIYRDILFDAIAIGKTFTIKLDVIAKLNTTEP